MSTIPIESPNPLTPTVVPTALVPYEEHMKANWEWAMNEASLFFEGKGKVQQTLRRITQRLNQLNIPYAVAGGMALFHHGHRRYTEDVDILVTREGLKAIHEHLDGLGFVRPFSHSKNLRDAETGVKIEFLLSGDFPGDGKPKDVAFPDPASVAESSAGVSYLNLPAFITLKLTSGLTGENRDKDLVDILELAKAVHLPPELADQLAPYVQAKYREIIGRVRRVSQRFLLPADKVSADQLDAMLRDGVIREPDGRLITTDPALAQQYSMWPEDEVFE
jgi:hypothetical protein